MFQNPDTLWIEILAIIATVAFFAALLGVHLYKKAHHLPTGECECCKAHKSNLVEKYHKEYGGN